jgi:hypothetical protein
MSAPEAVTKGPHPHEFHIQIDRAQFTVTASQLTGEQIRALSATPIAGDRDLYEIRPGSSDILVGDSDEVAMHDGLRFFTAPKQINPGA